MKIPTVFFSDSTGPCYHTAQDEIGVVDFNKLDQQIHVALRVTRELATTSTRPSFVSDTPLATYGDAVALVRLGQQLKADDDLFDGADRTALRRLRSDGRAIVAAGPGAFDDDSITTLLTDAAAAVSILTHGACDGFFGPVPSTR